jgi:hypothetical protein
MNIICFLTLRPTKQFYDFCLTLIKNTYEIYICIDDNTYNIPDIDEFNNRIKIIKINNELCELSGYKDSVKYFPNKSCNRDKTLYYFNRICPNINYENIWFIEEDVFVPNKDTIMNIDMKYTCDLLCRSHKVCSIEKELDSWNNWPYVFSKKITYPVAHSMICAVRVSKKLMKCIDDFVNKEKRLLYSEVLFNHMAIHNNLSVITPKELSSILYRYDWHKGEIKKDKLYHPIKDTNIHDKFRIN